MRVINSRSRKQPSLVCNLIESRGKITEATAVSMYPVKSKLDMNTVTNTLILRVYSTCSKTFICPCTSLSIKTHTQVQSSFCWSSRTNCPYHLLQGVCSEPLAPLPFSNSLCFYRKKSERGSRRIITGQTIAVISTSTSWSSAFC